MSLRKMCIDTTGNIFRLDGEDISDKLVSIKAEISGHKRQVTLTFDTDIVISGELLADDCLHPAVCHCGYKISDYCFDLNEVICPKCGRKLTFLAGQMLCGLCR